jgi:hypothetical protein
MSMGVATTMKHGWLAGWLAGWHILCTAGGHSLVDAVLHAHVGVVSYLEGEFAGLLAKKDSTQVGA